MTNYTPCNTFSELCEILRDNDTVIHDFGRSFEWTVLSYFVHRNSKKISLMWDKI